MLIFMKTCLEKKFGIIMENNMATIADCLKNALTCSKTFNIEASFTKFHKMFMARKACLRVMMT